MHKLVFVALLLLSTARLFAHDGGATGFAAITIDGNMLRYELTLSSIPASPLATEMNVGVAGAAVRYELLAQAITEHIHLSNNARDCEAGSFRVLEPHNNVVSVTASVDFVCSTQINQLTIRDEMFKVLGKELHTLAKIDWSNGSQQFAFQHETPETKLVIEQNTGPEQTSSSTAQGAGSFFVLGLEHILGGYDHLLFLLVLLLGSVALVPILKVVTGFTAGHSITLALAGLNILVLPSAWVEMAIALSIAYVAAENLFPRYAFRRRWVLSFVFGTVHGFGFSFLLREAGLHGDNLLWSLLSFNLGVEFGQAAVVLLLLPLLLYMRAKVWAPKVLRVLSSIVLLIAVTLFMQRLLS